MFARHIDTERESSNGTTFQMPSLYLFDVSYITKYQYCPAASMRDSLIPPFDANRRRRSGCQQKDDTWLVVPPTKMDDDERSRWGKVDFASCFFPARRSNLLLDWITLLVLGQNSSWTVEEDVAATSTFVSVTVQMCVVITCRPEWVTSSARWKG